MSMFRLKVFCSVVSPSLRQVGWPFLAAGGWTHTGIVVLVNLTLTTEPAPPKP